MPGSSGFTYQRRGSDAWLYHGGRHVTTLRGRPAADFLLKVASLDDEGRQHLIARLTGDFKRGNERR